MPRKPIKPVPAEIPKGQRKLFASLRAYWHNLGREYTVEDFNNRRKWGANRANKPIRNQPQTKEGVLAILRAKGLAP